MELTYESRNYGGDAAANYQEFFVPSIGTPFAEDLIGQARLRAGEKVLDVACGTGVVARLAELQIRPGGTVTGLDQNPGMLVQARANTDPAVGIDWVEADAETMPFEDAAFDVVLCQLGLQFIQNKLAALREMRRVVKPDGRVLLNVPGPKPAIFASMGEGITRHLSREAAGFLDLVFAMHDKTELADLFDSAGFGDVEATARPRTLIVPPPEEFLWQYIHSTPLAGVAESADPATRQALEEQVCSQWTNSVADGKTQFDVGITTVVARP